MFAQQSHLIEHTGLGWVSYSFVTQNIFVLVSNLPGLILSVWLNIGAAKLQYLERYETFKSLAGNDHSLRFEESNSNDNDETSGVERDVSSSNSNDVQRNDFGELGLPIFTPHEHWVIVILMVWGLTLSSVVFIPMTNHERSDIIGIVVNLNLVVFYGAPLSTIIQVFKTRSSVSIHRKTLGENSLHMYIYVD